MQRFLHAVLAPPSLPSWTTHAWSTLAAPANVNVPVNPATRHSGFSSGLGATGKKNNQCCSGSEMLGRCWVPWCSLRWLGQFSLKNPEPVGTGCNSPWTSCSCSSLSSPVSNRPVGGHHLRHAHTQGVRVQPSAVKAGFCQGGQQSQGSTWEPTSKDQLISWSSLE